MKRWALAGGFLVLVTTFLAGCGGGSADAPAVGGIAVDPYISGARFQEILSDGTPGQLSTVSDDQGRFSFPEMLAEGSRVVMVASGFHNGVAYDGDLKSCAELVDGDLVVSPFTTVLANLIASGLTEEEAKEVLLAMLNDAGHLLRAEDLTSDPMAGIGETGGLERLQGAMAVNGWLRAMTNGGEDGFDMTDPDLYLSHLQARGQLLANMSTAMKTYLGEENLEPTRLALQQGLPEGYPVSVEDMIRSAVATCDYLADRAAVDLQDGTLSEDVSTLVEPGTFEELVMRHYAERNMGNSAFSRFYQEQRTQDPSLPAVSSGQSFTMDDVLRDLDGGSMMGDWSQSGSWTMGGGWGMM